MMQTCIDPSVTLQTSKINVITCTDCAICQGCGHNGDKKIVKTGAEMSAGFWVVFIFVGVAIM